MAATGNFVVTFKERHSFETDYSTGALYDGAVIEVSTDGLTWYDVYTDLGTNPGYTAFLAAGDNPLAGRAAFVDLSTGYPAFTNRTA